jgi:glutamine synthetase
MRKKLVKEAMIKGATRFEVPCNKNGQPLPVSEYFGIHSFDQKKMKERLPQEVYTKWVSCLQQGKSLDHETVIQVARTVKEWAVAMGATHFCHWFQPQTGAGAEKHDAFLSFDDNHKSLEFFSEAQLIQSEPDASSFPSGGARNTAQARGYTVWNPGSPIFITENGSCKTLCVPSLYISYHGEALDEKTPLLRSTEVLSDKAKVLLSLLGDNSVQRVLTTLGPEQEYFLVDTRFYAERPDLKACGRTLVGAKPLKEQQLEDQYFASIPERVQAFIGEAETEMYKIGIPVKTRHCEVAPSQYEFAVIFEDTNIAVDHNMLTMDILKKVAHRHEFKALFHEKPYAGINGSGKHCNWSMAISSESELNGKNLLNPGKQAHENLRFLVFLSCVLKGVHDHAALLRAGIASSGNEHRLGANEAPPAIISVFMGDMLNKLLDEIESGHLSKKDLSQELIRLGLHNVPDLAKDNTDRNRTSPFAFTGNKFEFRAVGSSANPAFAVTLLNAAVTDAIVKVTERLKNQIAGKKSVQDAVYTVVRELITETKAIRFEGNNYSEAWRVEAESRGLPNLSKSPDALQALYSAPSRKMLTGLGVFTDAELHARLHVREERYIKDMEIELGVLKDMVQTQILPAGFSYAKELAQTFQSLKELGVNELSKQTCEQVVQALAVVQKKQAQLLAFERELHAVTELSARAKLLSYEGSRVMLELRGACDQLEHVTADEHWPLPKYAEMLFIS